jgi:RNase H-fold protein (predicted Holliday junction resolvase)
MELGNFLDKLKGREKEEPKQFLALVLTDEVVQAAVWSVLEKKTEIIAIGTPVEWDGDTGTTSELITAVDATISNAVEGLSEEPNEVILGIPHSWTDKDGVLGVKREFINKIRKELELKALGYVTITDSILSYLKMQEGTPTTSILIQVSRDELTLVLVRLGHIEAVETIGRGDDVVEDVTEGIAHFKIMENLPSRIILFNSMHNLDDIIQNLLSVNWQTQFNFLHLPKIEALAKDVTIRALAVAGGSEVAKSLGFAVSETSPEPTGSDLEGRAQPADTEAGRSDPEEILLSAQEIGFVEEKIDFIDPEDEPPVPITAVVGLHTPGVSVPYSFVLPKFKLLNPSAQNEIQFIL